MSLVLALEGGAAWLFASPSLAYGLLAVGGAGLAITLGKCLAYSWRTEIDTLPGVRGHSVGMSRIRYRTTITWLHLIQPLARMHGRIRGLLARPSIDTPADLQSARRPLPTPSWEDAAHALRLLSGARLESRFWSESWMDAGSLLSKLTEWLRVSRIASRIEIDSGWSPRQDMSVGVGRWGRLALSVLCEDHGGGRCMHRVASRFRPTPFGCVIIGAMGVALIAAVLRWPQFDVLVAAGSVGVAAFGLWRVARTRAVVRRAIGVVTSQTGMLAMAPVGHAVESDSADQDQRGRRRQARARVRTPGDVDPGRDDAEKAASAASAR